MRKLFFVFLISLITFNFVQASDKNFKKYSYLEIKTDKKEVYDDGRFRTVYLPFEIYNLENEKIIGVGESLDTPATVKLEQGEYMIRCKNLSGEKIERKIKVEESYLLSVEIN